MSAQPNPERVVVKRDHFFSTRALPSVERALGYRYGWRIGCRERMTKAGRQTLRAVMRECARDAVRRAREAALDELNERRART